MKREKSLPPSSQELLVHLAAGELTGMARWRLLRRIAREPELAHAWEETRALWTNLNRLQTLEARPAWQEHARPAREMDRPARKGIVMTPKIAIAACGFALLSVTGAFAAHSFFNPFRDMADRAGHVWHATPYFRGEVKIYDRYQVLVGSYGSDGSSWDNSQGIGEATADVQVDGIEKTVKGSGLQPFVTQFGETLGYVAIVPETEDERARLWAEHERKLGHEAQLSISSGASDGWGMASGFFGDGDKRMDWKFTGVGEVRFRIGKMRPFGPQTGKVIRSGIARPINAAERARLKKVLPPPVFATQVAPANLSKPDLALTVHGRTEYVSGYTTFGETLPDGTPLTIEILKPGSPEPPAPRNVGDHEGDAGDRKGQSLASPAPAAAVRGK